MVAWEEKFRNRQSCSARSDAWKSFWDVYTFIYGPDPRLLASVSPGQNLLEPFSSSLCDVQGVVSLLEEQFSPKVQAEFSVLVDVLHSPELLFPEAARLRCESGAFMSK